MDSVCTVARKAFQQVQQLSQMRLLTLDSETINCKERHNSSWHDLEIQVSKKGCRQSVDTLSTRIDSTMYTDVNLERQRESKFKYRQMDSDWNGKETIYK